MVARLDEDAPGYRHRDTGALNNVGNNGYSWSSTVSGTNGMNLNFNVTWLNPSNANNRAYGFQLRCLSAFTRTSRPFWGSGSRCATIRRRAGCVPECRFFRTGGAGRVKGKFSNLLVRCMDGLVKSMILSALDCRKGLGEWLLDSTGCPGLPQQHLGRTGRRRQQRL
ncbi:hypothetical protein [uncultured Rikenella sp.]|uniref:hypothetical protein n=2 Tax=uncultured Rikenella sp. TaxID=368003 RepID=UPI002614E2F7|nr:hypothetical protein [uncultured Rikenella sp.]